LNFLMRSILSFFVWLSQLAGNLAPRLAAIAGHPPSSGDFTLAAIVVASLAFAVGCSILMFVERARFIAFRQWIRDKVRRAQTAILLRDAIVGAGSESVAVLGTHLNEPLSFGGGSTLLKDCLAGDDAAVLAPALDALLANAASFAVTVQSQDGQHIAIRGRPIGGHAVVFLRRNGAPVATDQAEYRATLDALSIPVWIRDGDLQLRWANNAFLAAVGSQTLDGAIAADAHLDEAEREFARAAKAGSQIVDMRRSVTLAGEQRTLAFSLRALPDGTVAGMAVDVTAAAPVELTKANQRELFRGFINGLNTAVAVFGSKGQLANYNSAYARLWGLSETWLDSRPSQDEILDRLREARRLPERRDFSAWKRELLRLFETADPHSEELWHLPNGNSVRVVARPHPAGGVIFLFDDVTEGLRLESAYNSLAKVQAATLNAMQDGVAIFGTDCRLKKHNETFAQQWGFSSQDLAAGPHVTQLVHTSDDRFDCNRIWGIVLASINTTNPEQYNEWATVKRSDGSTISLSLTRLPDGATMATFSDVTKETRIRDAGHAAAA
jgi:PAS domain-containing protein